MKYIKVTSYIFQNVTKTITKCIQAHHKHKAGIGISIILENKYVSLKLSNTCLIFKAEATAIFKAIKTVIKKKHSQLNTISNQRVNTQLHADQTSKTKSRIPKGKRRSSHMCSLRLTVKHIVIEYLRYELVRQTIQNDETLDTELWLETKDNNLKMIDFLNASVLNSLIFNNISPLFVCYNIINV